MKVKASSSGPTYYCWYRFNEITEKDVTLKSKNPFADITLFNFQKESDTSRLNVLNSNLPVEVEKKLNLRSFILQKVDRGLVHPKGSLASLSDPLKNEISTAPTVFFKFIEEKKEGTPKKSILCLICSLPTNGLNLFMTDLYTFVERFQCMINDKENDEKIFTYLSCWFNTCVDYMSRIVSVLGDQLSVVIYAAIMSKKIVIKSEDLEGQIRSFLKSFNLSDPKKDENQASDDENVDTLVIELSVGVLTSRCNVNSTKSNTFCIEWANELLSYQMDSFQIRLLIDDKKLQILNELNSINQKVNEAKFDHYALYKAYNELKVNPNQDVLLALLLQDLGLDSPSKEVIQVIHDQIKSQI